MSGFNATATINTKYGNYEWDGIKGGYYPTKRITNRNLLLVIDIVMNKELFNEIDIIEIYDKTNFLVQYSLPGLKGPVYRFKFCVSEELVNTDLKIQFRKIQSIPTLKSGLPWLGRPLMETKYETTVTVPDISIQKAYYLLQKSSGMMNEGLCKSMLCTF